MCHTSSSLSGSTMRCDSDCAFTAALSHSACPPLASSQDLFRDRRYMVRSKAKVFGHDLHRRRHAEGAHTEYCAVVSSIAFPANRRSLLHGYPCRYRWRQHAVLVLLILFVEQLPRGHAYDSCLDTFRSQAL